MQLLAARGVRLTYSNAAGAARAGRVEALAGLQDAAPRLPGLLPPSQRVKFHTLYGGDAGVLRRLGEWYGVVCDMHGIFNDRHGGLSYLEPVRGGGG